MLNLKFGTSSALTASLRSALQTAKQAQDQMRESIEAIRAHIGDLQSQRKRLLRLPVTEDVAAERVRDWVRRVTASSLVPGPSVSGAWLVSPPEIENFTASGGDKPWELPYAGATLNVEALLLLALQDQIIEGVLQRLSAVYSAGLDSISEAERAEQLDAIDQQILDLELAEESIIRAAFRNGVPIERRPNVSSAVLEASDAELP